VSADPDTISASSPLYPTSRQQTASEKEKQTNSGRRKREKERERKRDEDKRTLDSRKGYVLFT
jgi:hypothetical protein